METFNKCLLSLRTSKSDSEKLAALMVITKVCDKINKEQGVQLFETITPKFLVRLMKTNSPEKNMFKVVALNILAFFGKTNPAIMLKDEQLVNLLLDVFNPSEEENSFLYKDILDVIHSLARLQRGANILMERDVFLLFHNIILNEDYTEGVIPIFECLLIHNNKLNKDFVRYLLCSTDIFRSNQEILKFHYLEIFIKLFQNITESKFQINYSAEFVIILKNICLACKDIMQSRVKANLKRSAIILLCCLLKSCGSEWILDKQCVESVGTFITLLLTVISVELTILFHTNIANDECDQRAVISGLYIAQNVLNLICSNSFECSELASDNDFILKVFSCLKNIMVSVYEFLLSVDQDHDIQLNNTILVSAISMVSIWATEETENLRVELGEALPVMLKVGEKDLENIMLNKQTPIVLHIMAPCFSQVLAVKEMRKVLVLNDFPNLYAQYLLYYFTSEAGDKIPEYLEALVHIIHQLTILEPKLCSNSNFQDLSVELVKFVVNLPNTFLLNSYTCLEIITVMLTLLRICEIEYSHSIEQAVKVSVQLVYRLSDNSLDNEVLEIWFITVQNIVACIGMYQLVNIFKDNGYLKDLPGRVNLHKDMKGSVEELIRKLVI